MFLLLMFILILLGHFWMFDSPVQALAIEENHHKETYRDAGIGKVEDRAEEDEVLSGKSGHP